MSTAQKLTYLNETKGLIKDNINLGGGNLTTEPFRQYATTLKNIYKDFLANGTGTLWNNWEKVTGTGTSLSLSPTIQGEMEFTYKGNTSQNGTPTPTSPIPVNVVSGDNTIKVEGKNKLQPYVYSSPLVKNGITCSYDEATQTYTFNGTCTTDNTIFQIGNNSINMVENQTTCSAHWVNGSVSGYCTFRIYDSNFGYSNNFSIDTLTSTNKVISQTTIYSYVSAPIATSLRFNNGSVANNFKVKFMVANSTDTNYEPYIGHSYPIYLGVENLFDISTNTDGKVLASNGAITDDVKFTISDYIKVLPNTKYTISWVYDSSQGSDTAMRVGYYQSDKTFISRPYNTTSPYTITTPNNCYYIRLCYEISSHTQIQVAIGTNHISTTPIELCKIGTYQDYIYKDNGSWYLHKEIGKVVLDGTQSIPLASGTPRRFNATYSALGIDNVKSGSNALETQNNYRVCDHFYYASGVSTWGIYYLHNNWLVMLDADSVMTDANALKTWLSNNNTSIYYVLATPTNTPITDTTLINQLEESKLSYISQTNISQVNNDLPFIIDVKALKNI